MPWTDNATSAFRRIFDTTWQVRPQLARTLEAISPEARICDLGAGGRRVRPDVFCVDIVAGPSTDLVADIHALPIDDAQFALVICTGTLNLCREPQRVAAECFRILRPGGLVHVETAMFQPYTPEPEDYWRWTIPGLSKLFGDTGFETVRTGAHIGPMTALACSAIYAASAMFPGRGIGPRAARLAAHTLFGPVKYFDRMLSDETLQHPPFAYGIYYVGRKPG